MSIDLDTTSARLEIARRDHARSIAFRSTISFETAYDTLVSITQDIQELITQSDDPQEAIRLIRQALEIIKNR